MAADSVQKEVGTFFCLPAGIFPIKLSETLNAYFFSYFFNIFHLALLTVQKQIQNTKFEV